MMLDILLHFSAFSFLFFGVGCLYSPRLIKEFQRYGIPQFRALTGFLQLIGAGGILVGYYYPPLQLISTFGLALLMFFGLGVRIKIKDSFWQSLPALLYCLLNSLLFWVLVKL